jgi:hypothetical protein
MEGKKIPLNPKIMSMLYRSIVKNVKRTEKYATIAQLITINIFRGITGA